MKAFGVVMALWGISLILLGIQTYRLKASLADLQQLTSELDVARAVQRADRETFAMQIKLVREASKHADNAHKNLADKAGLSDTDWLESVLTGMWNKDADSRATASRVDAGAVSGAASGERTATGSDASPVQRGNDAQGN